MLRLKRRGKQKLVKAGRCNRMAGAASETSRKAVVVCIQHRRAIRGKCAGCVAMDRARYAAIRPLTMRDIHREEREAEKLRKYV